MKSRTPQCLLSLRAALALAALLGPSGEGFADTIVSAPGVTLELCGDVDVDEVTHALAIEYYGEDFERTMVTVVCEGSSARVRVIGPSHPRGRIADVDLASVDEVARPRTLAMVAAEIWSAPEAPVTVGEEAPLEAVTKAPPGKYRSSLSAGLSVLAARRETFNDRSSGRYGYSDELTMLSLKVDWPLGAHLGLFLNYGEGSGGQNNLGSPMAWERTEFGLYVPVWRDRLRLDIRVSAGEDVVKLSDKGAMIASNLLLIDSNLLLPAYQFRALGVDGAYAWNDKLSILGWAGYSWGQAWDFDYRSPFGMRVGLGVAYDLSRHVRADLRAESARLRDSSAETGRAYSDDLSSLEVGLSYYR